MKEELLRYQNLLLEDLVQTKRYLYDDISSNARMVWIVGLRWVGKTTILLQKLRENLQDSLYFSMDNPKVFSVGLFNVVEDLYFNYGIRKFYIDEIHKYKDWNLDLKNIYDSFPKIKLMFSWSSSVDILKGTYDLSRRVLVYKLHTLSFREYLEIKFSLKLEKISQEDIFENSQNLEVLFLKLFNIPLLKEFKNYLSFWEFPFFWEWWKKDYILRLENIVNKIVYEDIASFYNLKTENLIYFKEILYFIINSKPWLFSANSLSKNLKISKDSVNNFVTILQEIWLIQVIQSYGNISQTIRKAKKLYVSVNNINSISSLLLQDNINTGRIRESFFINNFINSEIKVSYSKKGDFIFTANNKEIIVEIWWKNKTTEQLKWIENGFVIKDDISFIKGRNIPLWLFGFLY